jgi:hypothetical protein
MTGLEYPFKNSVILDLSSTCNIKNAKSRFDLDSFWPLQEDEENAIYTSDTIMLIKSYRTISVTI